MTTEQERWAAYLRAEVERGEYSRNAYLRDHSYGRAPPLRNLPPWRRWMLRRWDKLTRHMMHPSDQRKVLWIVFTMFTLFMLWISVLVAHSHEWYPSSCCGGQDCRPTPCDSLAEDQDGRWVYIPTHSHLAREQVQLSPDKRCHICINSVGNAICAFVLMGV